MRRIMPRPAVQRERKTHFLQHVSVVVYHRLVNAKSDWDAAGKEANKIRDPALEPEVIPRAVFCDSFGIPKAFVI